MAVWELAWCPGLHLGAFLVLINTSRMGALLKKSEAGQVHGSGLGTAEVLQGIQF